MNTIQFKRKNRNEKNKLEQKAKENSEKDKKLFKQDISRRYRYKRPTQVLKQMNVTLQGKMEELRLIPLSSKEDDIGSFFFDELDFIHTSESSKRFYGLYLEIVDLSQTLPLVLVNREKITVELLKRIEDPFFKPIVGKLLVALLRDCGEEIFEIFVEKIMPKLASVLVVTDIGMVQICFSVLAAGLKFMLKKCLTEYETFFKAFILNFMPLSNHYLRRFSTECLVYLIKKTRNVKMLKKRIKFLFNLTSENLGLDTEDLHSERNKSDFFASLLHQVLKSSKGFVNEQAKNLIKILKDLMSNEDNDFTVKALNLLVDSEFRFFMERKSKKIQIEKNIGFCYKIEEFLSDLVGLKSNGEISPSNKIFKSRVIKILTDFLLFRDGIRFDQKLQKIAEGCIRGNEDSLQNIGFLAKFMMIKKTPILTLKTLAEKFTLDTEKISCFYFHLGFKNSVERKEIRESYHKEMKKLKRSRVKVEENFDDSLPSEIFQFVILITMKYLEKNVGEVASKSVINIIGKFLNLFQKNLSGQSLSLKNEVYHAVLKVLKSGKTNFWTRATLLRICRFSKNSENCQNLYKILLNKILPKKIVEYDDEKKETDIGNNFYNQNGCLDEERIITKNGTLTSEIDAESILVSETVKIILKRFKNLKKNILEKIRDLLTFYIKQSNLEFTLLETMNQFLRYLKLGNKEIEFVSNKDEKSGKIKISLRKKMKKILFKGLESRSKQIREMCLNLLQISSGMQSTQTLLTKLQSINLLKPDFFTERDICMNISHLEKFNFSQEELQILSHFMIGYSSIRISTIHEGIKKLFIVLNERKNLGFMKLNTYQVYEEVMLKSLIIRNFYDWRIDITSINKLSKEILLGDENKKFENFGIFEEKLISSEIFTECYRKEFDAVDNRTHLERLFELIPSVLGYKKKKIKKGKKENDEQQDNESGMMIEEETKEDENTKTKQEDVEEMQIFNEKIFKFFKAFLVEEIQIDVVPSLRPILGQETTVDLIKPRNYKNEKNYFEEVLNLLDKSKIDSEARIRRSSSIWRMFKFIEIISSMRKIPSSKFSQKLFKILLEVLKYPDAQNQRNVLDCIKKVKDKDKILAQFYPILTKIIEKEQFKGVLLTFNKQISSFGELERASIMPIATSILYRKLIDKRGTGNHRNLNSIRDFVLDTISNFRKEEIQNLLKTLFLAFYCDINDKSTINVREILLRNKFNRLTGIVESIQNIIKKLGPLVLDNLEFIQEFLLQNLKLCKDVNNYFYEEYSKVKNVKLYQEVELTLRQKLMKSLMRSIKGLKQSAVGRVKDLYAHFIETDFESFTDKVCEINQDFIQNFGQRAYQKPPQIFKVFGCWSEGEMYKIYFFKYPEIFENIIKLLESEKINLIMFEYITDMMLKVVEYNISDENQTKYNLKERVNPYLSTGQSLTTTLKKSIDEEKIYSTLGLNLIKKSIPSILNSLGVFVNRIFEKGKSMVNLTRSDRKKAHLKMTEFCMFISVFIEQGEKTVQKFVKIIEKFWDVNKFNKISDRPQKFIKTAEQLLMHENEIMFQASMLGLMSNLAPKIEDIENFYKNKFLPFLSRLGRNSLRSVLKDVLIGITQNKNFEKLNLSKNLCLEIADMLELEKNLSKEKFDFEKITKFLIKATTEFENIGTEEKILIAVNSIAWAKSDELSVRLKSLDFLKTFSETLKSKSDLILYKKLILDTAVYYLRSHYGDEDRIKSTMKILKQNIEVCKLTKNIDYELPYADLEGLEIPEKDSKTKEKYDFFTKILNLKLVLRARGFRQVLKLIESGKKFEPRTSREVFIPLIEYFCFELWRETNNPSRNYSRARKDRVLTILQEAYILYGKVAGMLTFPQYVNHLKAIINYIGMPFKPQDTVLKLVCSCLDNINQNVVDVLKVIKNEYREKNSKYLRESFINQILKTYEDKKEFDRARIEGEIEDDEEFDLDEEEDEGFEVKGGMVQEDIDIGVDKLSDYQLRVLRVKVLKPLKRRMKRKSNYYGKVSKADKQELNPEVATAIVKLIRIFPIDVFNSELISAVSNIARCLKSKIEKIRQTARNTLCEICRELGPFFLGFVIKELSSHLTRGFEVHVRNYTMFKILDELIGLHKKKDYEEGLGQEDKSIGYGEIDYCVKDISKLILDEISGGLAQEKEAKEVRTRIKEFAKNKGYDCFRMIASKIDFKSSALNDIIDNIERLFRRAEFGSSIKKFDELMDNIVLGLHKNETVTREALFLWTITVNKRAIRALTKQATEAESDIIPDKKMIPEELKRHNKKKTYKIQEGAAQGKSIFKLVVDKRDLKSLLFGRLIANFSLRLFHRKLRSQLFSIDFEKDEEEKKKMREYMGPFIDQMMSFMNSEISKLMQGSLLIIAHIINWPVFTLEGKGRKLLRIILRIFSKMGSSDLNLLQCCFKMIKRIILTNKDFLPNSQISEVYILLQENLYQADSVTEPLHCLNAMITQQLFKERLYDILDQVLAGVIKTRNSSIRNLSKNVLLNFVENSPMSKNLLEKFFLKLVNNITFEETEGREMVIEILHKFVLKFPIKLYEEHTNVMVLSLITGIVNENNFPLKQKMKTLAAQILLNCKYAELNKEIQNFIDYCENFLQSENDETKRAGIVLIDSLFSAGICDNRVKSKMAEIVKILKNVSHQIGEFYIGIKEEKELKMAMKDSPWKNILIRENGKEFLKNIKKSKEVTVDSLFVISTFINSGFLKLEEIEELVKGILELKNHPDEDIKLFVYDMMSHLLSVELLDGTMKRCLKDLLMMLFSSLKNDFFNCNAFLVKSGIFVHKIYRVFGGDIKAIRLNFLSALDRVSAKSLKFYKPENPVYKKIFGLINLILLQYSEEKVGCEEGDFEFDLEELEQILKIVLRFELNGNIEKEEDLNYGIEEIGEKIKEICDSSDDYLGLYSKLKKEVIESKLEFKEKIRQMAVNDPEQYAKLKIKKGLAKRAKAKERIRDMKSGLYIPKKKVKKSV